jgi:hypothetical protein
MPRKAQLSLDPKKYRYGEIGTFKADFIATKRHKPKRWFSCDQFSVSVNDWDAG